MAIPKPQNTSNNRLSDLEDNKRYILQSIEYSNAINDLERRKKEFEQLNPADSKDERDNRREALEEAQEIVNKINANLSKIDEAISELKKDEVEDPTVKPDDTPSEDEALTASQEAEKKRLEEERQKKQKAGRDVKVTRNPDDDTQPVPKAKTNEQNTQEEELEEIIVKPKPKQTENQEANNDQKLKAIRDQRQKELQRREAIQRQYESTRDRDMREQILSKLEPTAQLKKDLDIIETQDRVKKLKREVDLLRNQVLGTKDRTDAQEAFSNMKAQIVEKEAQIGELENFFEREINNASEDIRDLASTDVPINLTRSERLRRDVLEEIDTATGSMQKGAIKNILRETNPLKALDLNELETLTPTQINQKYKNLLATLYNSNDPNASRAIRELQYKVSPFIDAIDESYDAERIRQQASENTAMNREIGAEANKKLYRLASDQNYESYAINFRTSEIKKGMREKYYERKREAIGNLAATTILPLAEGIGAQAGRLKIKARKGAGGIYRSRLFTPVRFGAQKWSSSRFGGWVNQKPGQIKSFFRNVDEGFANLITNKININVSFGSYEKRKHGFNSRFSLRNRTSTREEYERRKKASKGRSQTLLALRGLYEVTVGRAVNAIKNTISFAKDAAYTYSGAKRLSRMKTTILSGRVGKSIVIARRGFNGLTAGARALGAGARVSTITGLVAMAVGAGPLTVPLAVGAGLFGTANQLLSDTLASRSPSAFKFIERFQTKYGYLGTKHYLNSVKMEGPAIATFRGPRHWISSISRSFNAGFYGMGLGTLIGTALGNPLLGAAIGFGAGYSGKLLLDRVTNNLFAKALENSWIARLTAMPFFESVGLLSSVPWISHQINTIFSGQRIDKIAKNLLKDWINFRKPLHMLANLGNALETLHNVRVLISFSGVGTRLLFGTSAIGGALGMVIATQVLGLTLGSGLVAGAMVGSLIGGAIGFVFFGPLGTILVSTLGSTLGSIFGSWIDKLTGTINVGNQLFGLLSFLKSILDFLKSISGKFDPMAAFGLTLSIIFSIGYLSEINFNEIYNDSSKTTYSHQVTAQDPLDSTKQAKVLGIDEQETSQKVTINCLETPKYEIFNPNKTIIRSIEKIDNYYTIETDHNIFINISKPARNLETYGSLSKTSLVGTCK